MISRIFAAVVLCALAFLLIAPAIFGDGDICGVPAKASTVAILVALGMLAIFAAVALIIERVKP